MIHKGVFEKYVDVVADAIAFSDRIPQDEKDVLIGRLDEDTSYQVLSETAHYLEEHLDYDTSVGYGTLVMLLRARNNVEDRLWLHATNIGDYYVRREVTKALRGRDYKTALAVCKSAEDELARYMIGDLEMLLKKGGEKHAVR